MSKAFNQLLPLSLLVAAAAGAQLQTPDTIWRQGLNGVPGSPQTSDEFGEAFASGDFNGDGFQDLAVGVGDEGDSGAVQVFFGSAIGLIPLSPVILQSSLVGTGDTSESGDKFGAAVASGNFNGDAYDDLAIGAPGESLPFVPAVLRGGVVHVLYGSPTGLLLTGTKYINQSLIGNLEPCDEGGCGCETDDAFGSALVAGDFDGDGKRDDLAIGIPAEHVVSNFTKSGAVSVIYGPFPASPTHYGSNFFVSQKTLLGEGDFIGPKDAESFGAALAAGFLDNNGYEDLVIGAPFDFHYTGISQVRSGSAHIVFGSNSGLTTSGAHWWHNDVAAINLGWSEGDKFGQGLAVADFDGDGREDVAIGVPGMPGPLPTNDNAGIVHILYGANSASQVGNQHDLLKQGSHGIGGSGAAQESGDLFGFSLAAGRFADGIGPGFDYLAIGAPGEDVDGINSAGGLSVVYGSANGLNAAESNEGFSQNSAGFGDAESCEAFDGLGQALGSGDWNGDGQPDLAIGVPLENIGATSDGGLFHVIAFPVPPDIFLDAFESNDLDAWDESFEEPPAAMRPR